MTAAQALAIVAPALAGLLTALAVYVRALARKVERQAQQTERRMVRLSRATKTPVLTPPMGVPALPPKESESWER